jgi:predicted PP-loop superfamily ATPase
VDDPVNPAAVEDGAPALRTVGNRQVIAHGASLARILREVRLGVGPGGTARRGPIPR